MTEWDGRPQNPERDGPHVIRHKDSGDEWTALWHCGEWIDASGDFGPSHAAIYFDYIGPCLTPAEVAAHVAAAWERGRKDTLEAVASPSPDDWQDNEAVRVLAEACRYAASLAPPADLSDALAKREAAARREGIEAAAKWHDERARKERAVGSITGARAEEYAANAIRALLEDGR